MDGQPRRFLFLLLGVASVFVIIWGIRSSAYIINPILLALVITMTVAPLPARLKQRGIPGWLSLVLTIAVVVGGLLLVLAFSAYAVGKLATAIPELVASASEQQAAALNQTQQGLAAVGLSLAQIIQPEQVAVVGLKVVEIVGRSIFQIFIVLLIFGFMLSAAIAMPRIGRLGLDPDRPIVERATRFTGDIRRYVSIMTLVNFLVGLGDTVILLIIGVDFAVLWGLLAWVLGYIPSVGFWLALVPPVLLAYAEFGIGTALIVFVAYVLINGGVQNLLQPKLMGEGLKISPVVVFISVFVWAWLLGGIGAILAVPLTLLIMEVLDLFSPSSWLVSLMRFVPGEESPDSEAAQHKLHQIWDKVSTTLKK